MIDSSIELSDPDPTAFGGVPQLSTGGAGGEPRVNGRIVIRDSTITAGTIQVQTSFDWPGGTVVARDSTLTTTVGNLGLEASSGPIEVTSGQEGQTTVRHRTHTAPSRP